MSSLALQSCEPSFSEFFKSKSNNLQNTNKSIELSLQSTKNHLTELTSNIFKLSSHWQTKSAEFLAVAPMTGAFNKFPSQFALKIVDKYKDHEHLKLNLIFIKFKNWSTLIPL